MYDRGLQVQKIDVDETGLSLHTWRSPGRALAGTREATTVGGERVGNRDTHCSYF